MQNHSQREDVSHWGQTVPVFQLEELRWDVARRPASVVEVVLVVRVNSETEVDDNCLETISIAQHDILQLEVSMDDLQTVQVSQPAQDSSHQLSDFRDAESLLALGEHAQQVASFEVFYYHFVGVLWLEHSFEGNQVLVVDVSEDLHLVEKAVEFPVAFFESVFFKDFDCESLAVFQSLDFEDWAWTSPSEWS